MENGIEPKRTISLTWDDPWKKYEERWKKSPAARVDLCFIQISPGLKDPERKSRSLKK